MLSKSDKWASLFLLTFTDKPLKLAAWEELLKKLGLTTEKVNVYSETVAYKDNKDGTYELITGPWKGRLVTAKRDYIQVVKALLRKKDKSPFTIRDLEQLRTSLKADKTIFASAGIKKDHVAVDYYPYKDPFKIDKGKPKWPSLPYDYTVWGIGVAAVIGGVVAYKKKLFKKNA